MTSNRPLFLLIQLCWSLKGNDFLAWWIIAWSLSERSVCTLKFLKLFQVFSNGRIKFFSVRYDELAQVFPANTLKLVNCFTCVSMFLHWFKPIASRIFLFAVFKITFLICPNSFFAGFMSLTVGLLLIFYFWSFRVIKLLFSPAIYFHFHLFSV